MQYRDLREFLQLLEQRGALKRIHTQVNPHLEITEICSRTLHRGGPALLFENLRGSGRPPLLANLFGTVERIVWGMGREQLSELRELGKLLAWLRAPDPPGGLRGAWEKLPWLRQVLNMNPRTTNQAPCRKHILQGKEVDLSILPIQTCWPQDAGPLITWPLVATCNPGSGRLNLGIYRMQLLDRNRLILRWLAHRGGALDFQQWNQRHPQEPFPVSVALGADPATLLAAVTPIPDTLSEYAFAGLLRGSRTELTPGRLHAPLAVPASAEYVLEGHILPQDTAKEGPFGDHTGYYNEEEVFPVFTVQSISHREAPIYLSTYTGRPPDEPSTLGLALNELFIPIVQKQFPEIQDFYLPPEACSYRLAVISIRKQYPGHARQIMMGAWSFLRQFMYTKFLIVTDEDIDIRSPEQVLWAVSTRTDPRRDTMLIEHSPIDYLDFASPVAGLGSKMGIDATNKWPGESDRRWGQPIAMDEAVIRRVDSLWQELGLDPLP